MTKELKLNKKEQKLLTELIASIGSILVHKMDKGVEAPSISGTIKIKDSDREVVF